MPSSTLLRIPPIPITTILTNNDFPPIGISLISKLPKPFTQKSLVERNNLPQTQPALLNWSTYNTPIHKVIFEFIPNSTPKKVSLKFLNPVSHTRQNSEQRQKIGGQTRQSAFNQSKPTSLRKIASFLASQSPFHFLKNRVPNFL
jgi:hypothetical protein